MPGIFISLILVLIFFVVYMYLKYAKLKKLHDRTNEINEIMMSVSQEINSFKNVENLYRQLLKHTIELIKAAEAGSILIYDEENDVMRYVAAYGYNLEELRKVHFKKEELYLYKYSTRMEKPYIIRNPESFDYGSIDENNYMKLKEADALNMKATLCAPLYIDDKFYGVINVDNFHKEDAFTKEDVNYIQYICKQLQVAIKNVLLMNDLIIALRYDKLTGIYNRRYFNELMDIEMEKASRYGADFCLVMIDMDNFKDINDTYGHLVGDRILQYFAQTVKKFIRSSDIVARYAGDEFIMVFYHSTYEDTLSKIESIKKYLEENPYNGNIQVRFSAGICRYTDGKTIDNIITAADIAMYKQKRENKIKMVLQ